MQSEARLFASFSPNGDFLESRWLRPHLVKFLPGHANLFIVCATILKRSGPTSAVSVLKLSGSAVQLAAVLLSHPQVILADEPTTGLDAASALGVMTLLTDVCRSRRCRALVSLHQPRRDIWDRLGTLSVCTVGARPEGF